VEQVRWLGRWQLLRLHLLLDLHGLCSSCRLGAVLLVVVVAALHTLIILHLLAVDLLLHLLALFLRVVSMLLLLLLLLLLGRCVLLGRQHVHGWGAKEDRAQVAHVLGLTAHILRNSKHDPVRHDLVLLLLGHHHMLVVRLLRLAELGMSCGRAHDCISAHHVH